MKQMTLIFSPAEIGSFELLWIDNGLNQIENGKKVLWEKATDCHSSAQRGIDGLIYVLLRHHLAQLENKSAFVSVALKKRPSFLKPLYSALRGDYPWLAKAFGSSPRGDVLIGNINDGLPVITTMSTLKVSAQIRFNHKLTRPADESEVEAIILGLSNAPEIEDYFLQVIVSRRLCREREITGDESDKPLRLNDRIAIDLVCPLFVEPQIFWISSPNLHYQILPPVGGELKGNKAFRQKDTVIKLRIPEKSGFKINTIDGFECCVIVFEPNRTEPGHIRVFPQVIRGLITDWLRDNPLGSLSALPVTAFHERPPSKTREGTPVLKRKRSQRLGDVVETVDWLEGLLVKVIPPRCAGCALLIPVSKR